MNKSAVVVSVATSRSGYVDILEQSCKRHRYHFDLRGLGEEWRGFGWRMNVAVQAACGYHDDTLIVFADAYDVIMCDDACRLRRMYQIARKPFVIGVYRYIRTLAGPMAKHEFGIDNMPCGSRHKSPYQIPCAGVWVTTAKAVKQYLYPMIPFANSMDDQRFLNEWIARKPALFYIDCGVHFVMHAFPDSLAALLQEKPAVATNDGLRVRDHKLLCTSMNSKPAILHGIGNTDLDELLHQLNYPGAKYNVSSQYMHEKLVYHLQQFIKGAYHNVRRRAQRKTNDDDSYILASTLLAVSTCLNLQNWIAAAAHASHALMWQ